MSRFVHLGHLAHMIGFQESVDGGRETTHNNIPAEELRGACESHLEGGFGEKSLFHSPFIIRFDTYSYERFARAFDYKYRREFLNGIERTQNN